MATGPIPQVRIGTNNEETPTSSKLWAEVSAFMFFDHTGSEGDRNVQKKRGEAGERGGDL